MARGSKHYTIRFPEPLYSEIKEFVEQSGKTTSDVFRQAIKEYMMREWFVKEIDREKRTPLGKPIYPSSDEKSGFFESKELDI